MVETLKEKLDKIEKEYCEIDDALGRSETLADSVLLCDLSKRRKEIQLIVEKYRAYRNFEKEILSLKELMVSDNAELAQLALEDKKEYEAKMEILSRELQALLIPRDPLDSKNVIVEIRAAAGGEEASLFASELYRMYTRFLETNNLKITLLELNATDLGGVKEIIFSVEGNGSYGMLKYESGTHRVQRVPKTESSGRIHTSTVTVAVLVEPEDVEIAINPGDLKIDTYRAGGHGGQYLQKTDSAVRITHIPTNTVVACQDERSQLKNKQKAMKILKAKIYDAIQRDRRAQIASDRKKQVGTGERCEKIRTYNYPQDRITDHRINENWHNITAILDGDMKDIINKLRNSEIYDECDKSFKLRNENI
ncbi:MAG: Peptide chain release factor 1 [Elusimicrobia bacterium ADurb.Bin231]|nr:MAG: Peptide chain release factor 1 [Elusimicrobia bacterium ADurb.Bin231]